VPNPTGERLERVVQRRLDGLLVERGARQPRAPDVRERAVPNHAAERAVRAPGVSGARCVCEKQRIETSISYFGFKG
jgi:hypothetical protein